MMNEVYNTKKRRTDKTKSQSIDEHKNNTQIKMGKRKKKGDFVFFIKKPLPFSHLADHFEICLTLSHDYK